jgi:hypothetical protein
MFCVKCGTKLPDDANFCLKCGKSQNSTSDTSARLPIQAKWEYKELVIPLNFRERNNLIGNEADMLIKDTEHYNPIILEQLQREGENGWEPDGPTDIPSMLRVGRIKMKGTFSRSYVSVTIRMRHWKVQ